eukprot:GHVU01041037.1.p1 GENE.GHVU01041037.1~~GHVU01041037.1.p1  ORF type:complete len:480 (+),score=119.87 GHVU01041037.1:67-1440(+)
MTTALELNLLSKYSPCEMKKVKAVDFGLMDPEFLKQYGVVEIKEDNAYESSGKPTPLGLYDLRMGVVSEQYKCETCAGNVKSCPGHFGYINLHAPVYHVGFLTETLNALRSVCHNCSKLKLTRTERQMLIASRRNKAAALRILKKARAKKACVKQEKEVSAKDSVNTSIVNPVTGALEEAAGGAGGGGVAKGEASFGCGAMQYKYSKEGLSIYKEALNCDAIDLQNDEEDPGARRRLPAEEAMRILKAISDEDAKLLGFDPVRSRPEWMIISVLPVPPPAVRPYVQYGAARSEDDLTLKLRDILVANKHLNPGTAMQPHQIEDRTLALQYHIATIMNNEVPGNPPSTTRNRKPIKSLRQRLKGKEGRLRGNLMGKRVDFTARTVITGDVNLGIDEVGVPRSVAMNLTFPETVTVYNLGEMRRLVENGPNTWPGANYIIYEDGRRINLSIARFGSFEG